MRTSTILVLGALGTAGLLAACGASSASTRRAAGPSSAEGALDGGTLSVAERRALLTRTADITLLDRLRTDLQGLSASDAEARATRFLAAVEAQGGTPLVSRRGPGRVAFITQGTPSAGYAVTGSFNGWDPSTAPRLTPLVGTDLYAAELPDLLVDAGVVTYKLLDGTRFFEDLRAHNVVWDGIDHGGPGEFNAVVNPAAMDPAHGRLVAMRAFPDSTVGLPRDVFVYVPAAYDRADEPALPVLYFQDGSESLTRSPFTAPADAEYAAHPNEAALQVYVALPNQDLRISQYSFDAGVWDSASHGLAVLPVPEADLYTRFVADELRPQVEARFHVCERAAGRGIAGSSLGGLVALYAALQRPDVFGFVGSQSGSVFWGNNALTGYFEQSPRLPLRFYLDTGCPDDNCYANEPFEQALSGLGYPVTYVEQDGGQHDWPFWQARLPGLLASFRSDPSACP